MISYYHTTKKYQNHDKKPRSNIRWSSWSYCFIFGSFSDALPILIVLVSLTFFFVCEPQSFFFTVFRNSCDRVDIGFSKVHKLYPLTQQPCDGRRQSSGLCVGRMETWGSNLQETINEVLKSIPNATNFIILDHVYRSVSSWQWGAIQDWFQQFPLSTSLMKKKWNYLSNVPKRSRLNKLCTSICAIISWMW